MKKQLIGTTALVSAGLLAGAAVSQGALAADPLALSIGGYYQVSLEVRDEDDDTGQPGANLQNFGIYDDGEIQFTATTTLDNGIAVKARIEYEAFNQGGGNTTQDERYLEFGGAFGKLRIGSDDDAAYQMQYQAPVGAYQIGVNTTTFAVPAVGGNAITSYPTTYISATGDAQKIIYFSPRLSGFQLGLSYSPDSGVDENKLPNSDKTPGGQEEVFSVGLNFVDTLGGVDVAVAGGYNKGSLEAQKTSTSIHVTAISEPGAIQTVTSKGTNSDDIEQWSAGLNIGFSGFTVGGSFAQTNNAADNNGDQFTWDAGVTYSNGPLTVGLTYLGSEAENGVNGDDELNSALVSGTYNLGPGVNIWGGVKWYDYQSDTNNDANENEGFIVAIGSSVSF
jgi:hypothetical protein